MSIGPTDFGFVCILLAVGAILLAYYVGEALVTWAKRPRETEHRHKWYIVKHIVVYDPERSDELAVGTKFISRCSRCGELTERVF